VSPDESRNGRDFSGPLISVSYSTLRQFQHKHRYISVKLPSAAVHKGKCSRPMCNTEFMAPSADPRSVKVNLTTGTGVDIEWKDGHRSHYSFPFLRDACPCALCDDERSKSGRQPGEPPRAAPGALPMFKAAAKPTSAEGVGKYAIKS